MSAGIRTVGQQLQQSLESSLTKQEQRKLSIRIGTALLAGGFLVIGKIHQWILPQQEGISGMILALGAIIASFPIFKKARQGFLSQELQFIFEQLVGLALLATMIIGDYETAILIPLIMSFVHFLEERSILGAQAAIDGLKTLQVREASLITPEGEEIVKSESLQK